MNDVLISPSETRFIAEWRAAVVAFLGSMIVRRATIAAVIGLSFVVCVQAAVSYDDLTLVRRAYAQVQAADEWEPGRSVCVDSTCFASNATADPRTVREELLTSLAQMEQIRESGLSARGAALLRVNAVGSGLGIVVVVILAASLFGAEWRWRTIGAKVAAQPDRALLLSAQMFSMWIIVAGVALVTVLLASVVDLLMRLRLDIPSSAPAGRGVLGYFLTALLALLIFSSGAAGLATLFRSSLGGAAGTLLLTAADAWVASAFTSIRGFSLSSQVRSLLSFDPLGIPDGILWLPQLTDPQCSPVRGCTRALEDGSPGAAIVAMVLWAVVFLVISVVGFRSDISVNSN